MRFLRPEMAAWLGALPVAAVACYLHYRRRRRFRSLWTSGSLPPDRSRRTGGRRDTAAGVLGTLALALLAGALMRPQLQVPTTEPRIEPRSLVLMIDRSVSMHARDILPSRLERAAAEIQHFLRRKPDGIDRVALVGFAATSIVLAHPTDDVESLLFYLDWIRDDPTLLYGTDIGSALTTALTVARRERHRVPPAFVLISDGDDQSSRLERAAAAVRREGIRVHCIGVGSDGDVPVPAPGGVLLRDDAGRLLTTRFDERSLRQLARATGGTYRRSAAAGDTLSALGGIAGMERRQVGWTTRHAWRDLHLLFLAAAGAAVLGLMLLL